MLKNINANTTKAFENTFTKVNASLHEPNPSTIFTYETPSFADSSIQIQADFVATKQQSSTTKRLEKARETQNNLNLGLIELALEIQQLAQQTQDDTLRRKLQQCARKTQALAREGRQSTRNLRDPNSAALRQRLHLAVQTWAGLGYELHLALAEDLPNTPRSLSDELVELVESTLLRMRYGGAKVLRFAARQWQDGLELLLEDDGQPMMPDTIMDLETRAQRTAATLLCETLSSGGNRLRVRVLLPIHKRR